MFLKPFVTRAFVLSLLPLAAWAEPVATTPIALNLYAGPSKDFTVLEVIPANATFGMRGCLPTGDWCAVSLPIEDGWIYAPELAAKITNIIDPATPLPQE